jgi:hypothetical protein
MKEAWPLEPGSGSTPVTNDVEVGDASVGHRGHGVLLTVTTASCYRLVGRVESHTLIGSPFEVLGGGEC